jgi:hypothetical protein
MSPDAVISYSSEDAEIAQEIYRALGAKGIRCWIAPNDVPTGQEYAEAIMQALDEAKVLVLIFTANANRSRFVPREVERAFSKRLSIIQYRLEPVEPSRALELFVSPSQ